MVVSTFQKNHRFSSRRCCIRREHRGSLWGCAVSFYCKGLNPVIGLPAGGGVIPWTDIVTCHAMRSLAPMDYFVTLSRYKSSNTTASVIGVSNSLYYKLAVMWWN